MANDLFFDISSIRLYVKENQLIRIIGIIVFVKLVRKYGNILRYLRNGHRSSQYLIDSHSYHYEANTNKLNYIDDKKTGALNVYKGDLKDQSPNNYDYDEIGNLIKGTRDSITWTNAQKIDSIAKSNRKNGVNITAQTTTTMTIGNNKTLELKGTELGILIQPPVPGC